MWTLSFFAMNLLALALLPMIHDKFWSRNSNKALLSAALAIPVAGLLAWYGNWESLLQETKEYFSFIILLASLFIISGGIYIQGGSRATARQNVLWLASGALLANLFGTMGAAVILIRPFLRANAARQYAAHLPVFFIFLVCNIGGCLTPLGDSPLFMGHLRGVPFFWTLKLLPQWLFLTSATLSIFWLVDRYYWRREIRDHPTGGEGVETSRLELKGWINVVSIGAVLLSVAFLQSPFRELVMIAITAFSLIRTSKDIRKLNEFRYGPIIEVAVVFAGIFVTMIPALLLLGARGGEIGITQPWHYFWATGTISAFLDNTPSYLAFLSMAQSQPTLAPSAVIGIPANILSAISCGAVFMGALTYIGNGPNFIVKAVCESHNIRTPTFIGYMLWSSVVLLPLLILVTLIFYR